MKIVKRFFALLAVAFVLTGCANTMRGVKEDISGAWRTVIRADKWMTDNLW